MSFQQTQYSLPNFDVKPTRGQRAPYATIHNLPSMLNVTSYAGSTLPVTFLSAGSLFVEPVTDFIIDLPSDLSLFRFLGGFKYISNGDVQTIEIINRGSSDCRFRHDGVFHYAYSYDCTCLVIKWTTKDQSGNDLPIEDVYFEILTNLVD